MSLLFKHKFGDYGLITIFELNAIFGISIMLSYNVTYPLTRCINNPNESTIFNIILYFITIILSLLSVKNISLGTAQDIFDGTIITFLQLKGRKKLFFYLYFVDVLLQGLSFILIAELLFYLGGFNFGYFWILQFLDVYLLLGNLYIFAVLLTKKPFRSFLINIIIAFGFIGLYIKNLVNYELFILVFFILLITDYELFQRLSI
ncbi:hypothetical protein DFR86_03825 [Acidianus sulfidivorans JP7]|uniref:Uncharacterized protein n=1 Tax=Acidianus sulfidivorans JP7 TaxID=619593 RepID=A0A2U9IL45_9CREN|nr:hypothetical protein [Acidianus sulfidivorans]AWR96768.1 hypothetical protein DFR86_03825 [Acidianus sulfidivorans JP7]